MIKSKNQKLFKSIEFENMFIYEAKYSKMDELNFVEDSL